MGKFDFEISPDFIKQLGNLADIDRIAPMMIDESIPILVKSVKKAIKTVAGPYSTGEMESSVKPTHAKLTKYGYYACVRPTGKDKNGVRNMEKFAYKEYGTSKQSATPIIQKALKDAEPEVMEKMQEVFEREVNK